MVPRAKEKIGVPVGIGRRVAAVMIVPSLSASRLVDVNRRDPLGGGKELGSRGRLDTAGGSAFPRPVLSPVEEKTIHGLVFDVCVILLQLVL